MVPKHRRSEIEPPLASVRAPAYTAEDWPEAVGYGPRAVAAGPMAAPEPGWAAAPPGHSWQDWAPQDPSWQEWEEWQDWGPPPALHPDHPSAPVPRIQLPDDYPSGPMPAQRRSGPPELPQRRPGGSARTWNPPPQPPDAGYDNGNRRLYVVPDGATAEDYAAGAQRARENRGRQYPGHPAADLAGPDWPETVDFQPHQGQALPEVSRFQREPGPSSRDAFGYQSQTGHGWQETSDYWPETGPFEPGRGPATGRFQDDRFPNRDSAWTAGQVLTLADSRAAEIAQEAQDYAASICEDAERHAAAITEQAAGRAATMREAAEREAATIRETAERDAAAVTQQATGQAATIRETAEREIAELRTRLDSMTGELGRVAAYVTENLVAPAMPGTAPALPGVSPALPGTRPVSPATAPAKPAGRPAAPAARPANPATRPARPDTKPGARPAGPAKPGTTPAKKAQTAGRQARAMRAITYATAASLAFATVAAGTEIAEHGFSFFTFRNGGTGETPGTETDQQFEALQQKAAEHKAAPHKVVAHEATAPKGRHHKRSDQAVSAHNS
jgi:hypothetical protein